MQYMFVGCDELVKLDLHKWDVSNVTNMTQMFCSCKNLKELNLTGFDVSNVENMFCMFFECQNLTTIYCEDNWKDMATKLTESRGMFSLCEALMGGNNTIFSNSNPNDITYARPDGGSGDEGYFTKKERELYGAFTDASKKTLVLYYDDQKDTRDNVSDWPSYYSGVDFCGITKAVFDESIKIARPTTTEDWFIDCETLASIEHLEYLNTSKVTTMYNMFRYCKALTAINVNSFDISSLTSTTFMFSDCENLVYIICDKTWNTGAITDSNSWGMFDGCEKLKGGNGTTYVSNKDKIGYAHPDVAGDPGYFITEAQYKTATGMESVQPSAVSIQKVIENGVLYILRDGKMYNVMGVEVK
jgi:surface protein